MNKNIMMSIKWFITIEEREEFKEKYGNKYQFFENIFANMEKETDKTFGIYYKKKIKFAKMI